MCLLKHTHDYCYAPFATCLLLLRAYRYVPILRAYCYTFCYVPATTRLSLYEPTATRLSLCAYCYAPITNTYITMYLSLRDYHFAHITTRAYDHYAPITKRLSLCDYHYALIATR